MEVPRLLGQQLRKATPWEATEGPWPLLSLQGPLVGKRHSGLPRRGGRRRREEKVEKERGGGRKRKEEAGEEEEA